MRETYCDYHGFWDLCRAFEKKPRFEVYEESVQIENQIGTFHRTRYGVRNIRSKRVVVRPTTKPVATAYCAELNQKGFIET